MNEYIDINILARPIYQKCNCCNTVVDIYYQINIKSKKNKRLIQGTLNMCKSCGQNFNEVLGNEIPAGEVVLKKFEFNK